MTPPRALLKPLAVLAIVAGWSVTALAQLDPLTLIKRVPPTVVVIFDTSLEMLKDNDASNGKFYDPGFYSSTADPSMAALLSLEGISSVTYRRQFVNFKYAASPFKYTTDSISFTAATWNPSNAATRNSPNDNALYFAPTRWQIARTALAAAAAENSTITRWGLVRLRQKNPAWRSTPGSPTSPSTGGTDCDKPVAVNLDPNEIGFGDSTPCNAGGIGNYGTYAPKVDAASYAQSTAPAGTLVYDPTPTNGTAQASASFIQAIMARQAGDAAALIPAGIGGMSSGGVQFADRPLSYALDDTKAAIQNAMAADSASMRSCRNYVVVLVTGGGDSGNSTYLSSVNAATRASGFTTVTGGGTTRHVPIHVISINALSSAQSQLQAIATNSGGVYHDVSNVTDVQKWIDYAVSHGYARQSDIDAGKPSEFDPVSPIVGTVDLTNSFDSTGSTQLPNTTVHVGNIATNPVVPQRSNVMVTAGFELPGFAGRLRAFRVFQPQVDSTASTGWRFVNDGTKLWPDLDGRPSLAGQARTPSDPNTRNVYTYIPNGSGGGSLQPFTTGNVANLYAAMGLSSATQATSLITAVRAQPLGSIVTSTPGIMSPPSLDPPPDNDYGRADAPGTFAGDHFNRRSIIFVGANDGMMHAIDAKTGYEVWAFIPANLLPKLQALVNGTSVEQFDYFVDSSPKLAEVKLNGSWRSLLLFGEGWGGTFYQCFDVTGAGMGVDPTLGDLSAVNALLSQFSSPGQSIQFKWAFPNYNHFDPTILRTFALTDGSPGGQITFYGDVNASATLVEKTVGFTWADPAIGPLDSARSINGVVVGSGYFPPVEASLPNRGASSPAAGNAFYLLNADTGVPIGNNGSTCVAQPSTGNGCLSVGDVSNGRKNAIQADPTAAGVAASPVITKAYVGDVDGRYWRMDYTSTGAITANLMTDTGVPIYASSALLFIGTTDVYMFFATGSDMLPPTTSGGTGTFRMYGLKDNAPGAGSTIMFSVNLATVTQTNGLVTGERPSASPTVAGDIVFFTTTTESASTPCSDFSANLYAITYTGTAAYDTNNNGRLDNNESNLVKTVAGRATAPFIVDQHLYFATSGATGANVQAFGDPQDFNNGVGQVGVRILSWREIR